MNYLGTSRNSAIWAAAIRFCSTGSRGFVVTGVMPDANGLGRPDLYMSKRVIR